MAADDGVQLPSMQQVIDEGLGTARGANVALAQALGVDQATVSRWRTGKADPAAKWWPAIEAALGMEAGTLAQAAGWESVTTADGTTIAMHVDPELTARVAANMARIAERKALADPAVVLQRFAEQDARLERIERALEELLAATTTGTKADRPTLRIAANADGPVDQDQLATDVAGALAKAKRQATGRPRRTPPPSKGQP